MKKVRCLRLFKNEKKIVLFSILQIVTENKQNTIFYQC